MKPFLLLTVMYIQLLILYSKKVQILQEIITRLFISRQF